MRAEVVIDEMALNFRGHFFGRPEAKRTIEARHPKTWLDALFVRIAELVPEWQDFLLRRVEWSVKREEVTQYRICPHKEIAQVEGPMGTVDLHQNWMLADSPFMPPSEEEEMEYMKRAWMNERFRR